MTATGLSTTRRTAWHGPPEICDGLDNDCDGGVDEAFPTKGDDCMEGVGECLRMGTVVCTGNGSGVECNATPGNPAVESCNDKDDDCDDNVDEAFPTKGDDCEVGVGECRSVGTIVCTDNGSGVECDATPGDPAAESCNGLDDDCDAQIDETCACNPLMGDEALIGNMDGLGALAPGLNLTGAAEDTPGLDSACAPDPGSPRNEQLIVWTPSPGLRRIEVIGTDFDPQIALADLCRSPTGGGGLARPAERACVRDSGIAPFAGAPDLAVARRDRAAAIVVDVPEPAPAEVGIYIESADGVDGPLSVEITDPTGGDACGGQGKSLTVGGTTYTGADRCRKRLWRPLLFTPDDDVIFHVVNRDEVPPAPFANPRPDGRWDDPRFCLDNDGRASSVEVDWAVISADGVQGVMLPAGAERGDWWSVALPPSGGNRLFIDAEPVGLDSACAGNSMRLVAYVTCAAPAAPPNFEDGDCATVDPRTLRCDPNYDPACGEGLLGIDGRAPKRSMSLINIVDGGCRDSGDLVLHVGVLREDAVQPANCDLCWGGAIDPAGCFTYRLRVTE